jgi:hypothetical protein
MHNACLRSGRNLGLRVFSFAIGVLVTTLIAPTVPAAETPEPINLRVLYAGKPGSDREADFKRFLEENITKVGTGDFEKFKPADADDYDVVIFDWPSTYPRNEDGTIDSANLDGMKMPTAPELGENFDRPAVLIGVACGTLVNSPSLNGKVAINWKCLCLKNDAHTVNLEHAIFKGPRPVQVEFHDCETPAEYYLAPGIKSIGEPIPVWTVHAKTFPEIDPGLVSSRENFTATSDAEVIAGGINSKGPSSVAIGRHGNYLQWGFNGEPTLMTDSGKSAFINAVCYINKFDGQKPGPVTSLYGGRDSFVDQLYFLRSTGDAFIDWQVAIMRKSMEEQPIPEEMREQIGDDPAAYLRKMYGTYVDKLRGELPQDVRDACHDDGEQLIAYYEANREYLWNGDPTSRLDSYVVDEDVKQLGLSNRSVDLLDRCITMLETGTTPELARRLLGRYASEQFETADQWREWLTTNRAKLQFRELEGRFAVDP